MFLDYMQYNTNPLPSNLNEHLIHHAIHKSWTVPQLVWTAIALRTNAMPILWAAIQDAFEESIGGAYGWRMPIPQCRIIRRIQMVAIPTQWFHSDFH